MKNLLFIFISFLLSSGILFSQTNGVNNINGKLTAGFLKQEEEVAPASIFFNILKINNPTSKNYTFTVKYSIPAGWSYFADEKTEYSISPGDSLSLPLRISVPKKIGGGIAYVAGASLFSVNNKNLANASFFLETPKERKLRIYYMNSIEYFNKERNEACFKVQIKNKGNVEEAVNFNIELQDALTMPDAENRIAIRSYIIPANTDTVIKIKIYKDPGSEDFTKLMQMVKIKVSTMDTTFKRTVWVKGTSSAYTNKISESKYPLVVDLVLRDILSYNQPRLYANLKGTVLLKNDRDIYYEYRNMGNVRDDFLNHSWMYVGYRDKKINAQVGDMITPRIGINFPGKGFNFDYRFNKRHLAGILGSKVMNLPVYHAGGRYNYFGDNYTILTGLVYSRDEHKKIDSQLASLGGKYTFANKHKVNANLFISDAKHYYNDTPVNKQGLCYILQYSGKFDRLSLNLKNHYGSRYYTGVYNGMFNFRSRIKYDLNKSSHITLDYINYETYPYRHLADSVLPDILSSTNQIVTIYSTNIIPKIYVYGGTKIETHSTNKYYISIDETGEFATSSAHAMLGFRLRGENRYSSLGGKLTYGYANIDKFLPYYAGVYNEEIKSIPPFATSTAGLSFYHRYWKVFLKYYYGPYGLYQQYAYFISGKFPKTIYLMPQYERFLYKDILKLQVYSYYSNTASSIERTSFNIQFFCYLNKGWTLRLLNNIYFSTIYDAGSDESYSLKSNYMEFGLKKAFDWQQPRLKYYNINVIFFKDLNSNHTQDNNEPGVKNVLVYFERQELEEFDEEGEYNPYYESNKISFTSSELLSDQHGTVSYFKIPEGTYKIYYKVLSGLKEYNVVEEDITIAVNKHTTYYVPFAVGFKVFGKVILSRDEFSTLGKVNIANIKVSATDTAGNTFSTLTNNNGRFNLYIPFAGKFKIRVNNIFYKNFDTKQDMYEIDLDGHRQFEINFMFDEKRREIHFNGDTLNKPFDNSNLLKSPDEFDRKPVEDDGWDDTKKFGEKDKPGEDTGTEPTREITEEELKKLERIDRIFDGEDPEYFDTKEVKFEVDTAPTIKYIEKILESGKKPKDDTETEEIIPDEDMPESEEPEKEEEQPGEPPGSDGTTTEETQPVVDESTTVTESGINDQSLTDIYVDEDFEMFPISTVKDKGLIFKIQLYTNERERLKISTLADVEDITCVRSPGSPDPERGFYYYSKTFSKYEDAEAYKLKLISGGFYTASITAFQDGKKITLEEAGVY